MPAPAEGRRSPVAKYTVSKVFAPEDTWEHSKGGKMRSYYVDLADEPRRIVLHQKASTDPIKEGDELDIDISEEKNKSGKFHKAKKVDNFPAEGSPPTTKEDVSDWKGNVEKALKVYKKEIQLLVDGLKLTNERISELEATERNTSNVSEVKENSSAASKEDITPAHEAVVKRETPSGANEKSAEEEIDDIPF